MNVPINRTRIALTFMTAAATVVSAASLARASPLAPTAIAAAAETICIGSPIPVGFVIIAQATNFSCSSSLNNALVIKQPGPTETVCIGSPIPAGYVITGQTTNVSCSGGLNNAQVIKKL